MKYQLLIKDVKCWRCDKDMKIALLFTGTSFLDPSEFSLKVKSTAEQKGVKIEVKYSHMLEEIYEANICPNCDSMQGKMFLSQYWYLEDSEVISITTE